ncbi:MAG TPA: AbrB/MazE/SpoVT family DNA-binding domain-containing protein [Spirochaetota bacterium]|nr:AbrB/MazE/SpoVT family DNA-binding domain-containing protein [Spirochaetota bacterium]
MTVKIITIGNSKGIRIPNNVLKSLEIDSEVDLIVNEEKKELLLRPVRNSRQGWERAFKKMNQNHDDRLLVDDTVDSEMHDWEW